MRSIRKLFAALLALCLCAGMFTALAAGLDKPKDYIGAWEGGEDYGETREYYLEVLDFADGVFTVNFDIYRIWGFEGMTALVTEDGSSAILSTRADDDYTVLAALDFDRDSIRLTVLDSDYPDLPADTTIGFERSTAF